MDRRKGQLTDGQGTRGNREREWEKGEKVREKGEKVREKGERALRNENMRLESEKRVEQLLKTFVVSFLKLP